MKLTTKQLKQMIKEELHYLSETDEESINEKDIQELFKVGISDYEMMQTLIEDTFGKKEGQDYSLLKGKNTRIVTIYSDDEEFLQLIDNSLEEYVTSKGPVSYGVEETRSYHSGGLDVGLSRCKVPWKYILEIFKPPRHG